VIGYWVHRRIGIRLIGFVGVLAQDLSVARQNGTRLVGP
jgi:hypothetical protein